MVSESVRLIPPLSGWFSFMTVTFLGNFDRGHVPLDIKLERPVPDLWSPSYLKAAWPSITCSTSKFFKQHSIVIDITLCGDWAGSTYGSAGCPGTCAQQVMTASNFDSKHEPLELLSSIAQHIHSQTRRGESIRSQSTVRSSIQMFPLLHNFPDLMILDSLP